MHWSDKYPHDLYASVLLLDGKIENWKIGDTPKKSPGMFSGFWKPDRMREYTAQTQVWTVNNFIEHQDVFNKLAPQWFRQWPHAEDYFGFPAYSTPMKAITIWQPWATLIALRLKGFETRGWPTKYRGVLAIHAAKKIDREACEREPIKSTLAEHGYTADNLPTGAVVAIATLADCQKSVEEKYHLQDGIWEDGYHLYDETFIGYPEYEYGDFTPGRFAWKLSDVKQLPRPILAKGQQGLWNWDGAFQ